MLHPTQPDLLDCLGQRTRQWQQLVGQAFRRFGRQRQPQEISQLVAQTVCRVLFLRLCEACQLVRPAALAQLAGRRQLGQQLQGQFAKTCRHLGLPVTAVEPWRWNVPAGGRPPVEVIDEQRLRQFVAEMARLDIPSNWPQYGPDLLGAVYERCLAAPLEIGRDEAVVLADKATARRASGVYYTPGYVVDFLVQQTLGRWLTGKTADQVAGGIRPGEPPSDQPQLSVLDPACGGGAFLIRAYRYLASWLERQRAARRSTRTASCRRGKVSGQQLGLAERYRILQEHLFGLDIDPLAVEVTRLALLLELHATPVDTAAAVSTEGKTAVMVQALVDNIRVANALDNSSPVASVTGLRPAGGKETRDAGNTGRFDIVLGNPPYGAQLAPSQRRQLARRLGTGTADTAALFMALARQLTRPGGYNGLVVPKAFAYASNWHRLRGVLLDELELLADVGQAWSEVRLEQLIYVLRRRSTRSTYQSYQRDGRALRLVGRINKADCRRFNFFLSGIEAAELQLARQLRATGHTFSDVCTNRRGAPLQRHVTNRGSRRAVGGRQIRPFYIAGQQGWIRRSVELPACARVEPDSLLVQNIVAHIRRPVDHIQIIAAPACPGDVADLAILDTVNQLVNRSHVSSLFLLGLLSSRLINWYAYRFIFARAVRTMHFDGPVTQRLPIRIPRRDLRSQWRQHERIVQKVRQLVQLARQAAESRSDATKADWQQRWSARQRQLDHCVYDWFGLSSDQIRLVEGGG